LGVTPSAWSQGRAIEIINTGYGIWNGTSSIYSIANTYFDGGFKYANTGSQASYYYQFQGAHVWATAPSGTAGNAITFTQAMTLDASGNLGIGTTSPDSKFVVQGGSGTYAQIKDGTVTTFVQARSADSVGVVGTLTNHGLALWTNSTERARITSVGNFSIGGTADRATTVGTKTLNIFDGTAPVGTLANGVSFYSTAGEARVMDAAGNATLLSPHDTETNEWIFHSKHTPSGKVLRIDVERLLRFVNEHFGLDAVKEFVEE
jgi:hypothetical protein